MELIKYASINPKLIIKIIKIINFYCHFDIITNKNKMKTILDIIGIENIISYSIITVSNFILSNNSKILNFSFR